MFCLILSLLSGCQEHGDTPFSPVSSSLSTMMPDGPVINEIMFAPLQSSRDALPDQPDYIELYNTGPDPADLTGWVIQDCPSATGRRYTYEFASTPSASNILEPESYAVIVPEKSPLLQESRLLETFPRIASSGARVFIVDRSRFSLNNDMDCVVLKNAGGTVIDSVAYNEGWHSPYILETRGRSIEKFNPLLRPLLQGSWSSSMNRYGGTPGERNSIYLPVDKLTRYPSITITPSPFNPETHVAGIELYMPSGAYQLSLTIYNVPGKAVRTLATGLPVGPETRIAWDGRDDDMQQVPSGIYLARAEVSGTGGSAILEARIVVAR